MKKVMLALVFAAAAWAQPVCVQIKDTLYSVGVPNMKPMTGYIDLQQGYTAANGTFVVTQSGGRLTVTNGKIDTCQNPGQIQAAFSVKNDGPVTAYTRYTELWTIPGGAGPYTVQDVLGTRAVSLAWTFGGLFCQGKGAATGTMACPGVPAPKSLIPGMIVILKVDADNVVPLTLNMNNLGAYPVNVNAGGLTVGTGSNVYQMLFDGFEFTPFTQVLPGTLKRAVPQQKKAPVVKR